MEQPSLEQILIEYPIFRQFVYAKVREEFDRTLPPLEGDDLSVIAEKEGGVPLEAFIHEIENGPTS